MDERDQENWATRLDLVRNPMSWREWRYRARLIPCEMCGGTGFDGWGVCDNCIGGYAGLRPTLLERFQDAIRRGWHRWIRTRHEKGRDRK